MSKFLDSLDIRQLNKYQINKRNWLMDSDKDNENTIIAYWKALENNNVNSLELARGRDLYTFSTPEIREIINYAPTVQKSSKVSLLSIISIYFQWANKRGLNPTGDNPCNQIKLSDIKINKTAFDLSYLKLDDFYDLLNRLDGTDIDKMVLVMARYGIEMKDMSHIKWEDVDRENKIIYVEHMGRTLELPIDDRFIERVDKAKEDEGYEVTKGILMSCGKKGHKVKQLVYRPYKMRYSDVGYIIKKNANARGMAVGEMTLRNKVYGFTTRKTIDGEYINRPNVGDYNKSRLYDLLFEALEENGVIGYDADLRRIIIMFEGVESEQMIQTLKQNFEILTGYTVETRYTKARG